MAQLGQNFNANDVEPNAPRDLIPAGKYTAQIIRSDMKDSKKGGQYLEIELEIVDGQYARQHLWDRLNLVNSNAKAVEIAERTLSAICRATGQMQVSDSEALHWKPMTVTVKVAPADGQYAAKNEIGGYETANGARPTLATQNAAPQQAQPQTQRPAPAQAAVVTPPWRKTAAA